MPDELEHEVREATSDLIASRPNGVLWSDLDEMGWFELADEQPQLAVSALFEGLGAAAVGSEALDAAVLVSLAVAGEVTSPATQPALVYYPPGRHSVGTIGAGSASVVDGLVFSREASPQHLLAPVSREDGSTVIVLVDAADAVFEPVEGVDPSLALRKVRVTDAPVIAELSGRATALFGMAARRAVAHETLGLARAIRDVAVEHVTSRTQFGRAIGSYQAVQHRLTDIEVGIAGAAALVELTWQGEPDTITILTAKALASGALETAVRNALQVCGGMGFTEEFPLARLVRRALFLSAFLGGAPQLSAAVGRSVIAAGRAPRLSGFAA